VEVSADGRTSQKLEAPWLKQEPLARLLAVLNADGEEARVVGGAVRNALLGEPIHEIDIATTAVPDEVVRRVTAAGFKAVPTGIAHGTVTVVADKHAYEVTTLRQDVETFGRHATVAFDRDWRIDAERRDFTINAFSAAPDGTLYDYVGGLADLAARRVRFIGKARARIEEDYLRILRFFRFHAAYGAGAPDIDGLHACIAGRAGLDKLSRERVRMELMKLLVAARATPTLVVMSGSGLLLQVLGGVPYLAGFENMAKAESAAGLAPDPVQRLGALAVLLPEDANRLHQRLRLTNAEHARLTAMGTHWRAFSPAHGEPRARELLYLLGPASYIDCALLAWARSQAPAHDEAWRALVQLPQRWTVPAFPIKAADFISRGLRPGPALGEALRKAEQAWIEAGFPTDAKTQNAITSSVAAGFKTTRYFEEQVLRKRPYIRREWCSNVIAFPIAREVQSDGRNRFWGKVQVGATSRILRVVTLEDGQTILNAFFDRGFREQDK
jgi:poly(A) polymerase